MDPTTVEDLLLPVVKYPLLGVQIIGYVPLTVTQTQAKIDSKITPTPQKIKFLQFRLLGVPVLFQIFTFITFSIFSYLFFASDQQRGGLHIHHYSQLSTDLIIISAMVFFSLINAIGSRIHGLFSVRDTLEFWQMQCRQLAKISKILTHPEFTDLLKKQVNSQFCWTIFFLLFPMLTIPGFDWVFFKGFGLESFRVTGLRVTMEKDSSLFWGVMAWIYFTYSHIFLSNWVTFFVMIYNLVLKCVIEEVETLRMSDDLQDFVNFDKIDEVTRSYDMILGLVDYFNKKLSVRLIGEVCIGIVWILGCTYFAMISYKTGEMGSTLTNLLVAGMAMRSLYTYGNEGENLEQNRIVLVKALCDVRGTNLGPGGIEKLRFLKEKVINCKLGITPGNFFTLNRSFVLSIWSGLITLLLVMAQFRDSDEMGNGNVSRNEVSIVNISVN
ncbi:hypothetical protein Fcan01_10154 [Folsomia candida]|uniref:Gustatory receptor n=1 Tax=Folsomia candida TaxID=158441 RepID=A0A226E7X6_FOLCA|nr:hypothetical protein Fcan01_10154 [Folsomia candida]